MCACAWIVVTATILGRQGNAATLAVVNRYTPFAAKHAAAAFRINHVFSPIVAVSVVSKMANLFVSVRLPLW